MITPRKKTYLTRNVIVLGFVSLLNDAAGEMIMPLLPIFVTTSLGGGALAIGWIEGVADGVSSILKLIAGRASDRLGTRAPFVKAGYTLTSFVRPFVAVATAPWHVVVVRILDRVGKGLRSGPRDALLADSVEISDRAAAFSLHRAMDHIGAIIGPLAATAFLFWVSNDLRLLFWCAAIPSAATAAVVLMGVREQRKIPVDEIREPAIKFTTPPRELLSLLVPLSIFTLGNASDIFLLLKAGEAGASTATLPLLWVALHVVKSSASLPAGKLADRVGRRRVIAAGWVFYAIIYVGFAFAQTQTEIWTLFIVYGLYHALTEGAEKALVAELVPRFARGAGFGWYHLTLGTMSMAASVLFGVLWDQVSPRAAFLTSAALAVVATGALALAYRARLAHPPNSW